MADGNSNTMNDRLAFALSQLALDSQDISNLGAEVSAEELALLAEDWNHPALSAERRDEILQQILAHPNVYEQWQLLADVLPEINQLPLKSTDSDTADHSEKKPEKTASLADRFSLWVAGFWRPQVAVATFASALCVWLAVATQSPEPDTANELAISEDLAPSLDVYEAEAPAQKAARSSIASSETPEAPVRDASIGQWLNCALGTVGRFSAVCYSKTDVRQHWFLREPSGAVEAIQPLLQAERVIGVQIQSGFLLLEFVADGQFQLQLRTIDGISEDGQLMSKEIYQDKTPEGYFDSVKLEPNRLIYSLVKANSEPVEKVFTLPDIESTP